TNLTQDVYSDIQPEWSPDGKYIYFVSDRSESHPRLEKASLTISRLELANRKIETFDLFKGSDNFNPLIEPDGKGVLFLSDRDGFRNLYRYDLSSQEIRQLTNYYTGISGITLYSPAVSISRNSGEIAYT